MNGSRQAFQHAFFGQNGIGRMELFELIEVIENLFDDGVDHFVRLGSGGNEGGLDAEGRYVGIIDRTRVIAYRNKRFGVVGLLGDQGIDARAL